MLHRKRIQRAAIWGGVAALALWLGGAGSALAADAPKYPSMAPIADYQMAQSDEIAMARSAAPPSIGNDAEVMTLGASGYDVAAKGKNGFVCMVQRGWANEPDNAEFWSPKVRGPLCFNPAAVRSVMPTYLERTKWVLAGASREDVIRRTKAAIAAGRIHPPEPGAMSYMLSKAGYLGDNAGEGHHWHPHLMLFMPRDAAGHTSNWGQDLDGAPVFSSGPGLDPAELYYIPLAKWSDGSWAVTPSM
jgi:hypothetical protein